MAPMDLDFRMHAERTPNPNSVKWVLSQPLLEGVSSAYFDVAPGADVSPLAARIFQVEGVAGVFFGANFVTVTKREEADWTDLAEGIVAALKASVSAGESALGPAYEPPEVGESGAVVERIQQILEEEIRPYVAMDGGEITFVGFREGIVEVVLQGACAGCPSSTATLKLGIESRLKEELPEVVEVVAL
ncbi:MAG: NifU family protein [Proteobacteria bacterium]|nr:NifU family protein [Pseudomonadota bacterium]